MTKMISAKTVAADKVAAEQQPMQAAAEAGATKQAKMAPIEKHEQEPVQVTLPPPSANLASNVECESNYEVSSPPPSAVLATNVKREGNSDALPEQKILPPCDEVDPTGADGGWSPGVPVLVLCPQVAPSLSDRFDAAAGRWLQENQVRVSILLLCVSMLLMLAILLTMVIDIEELYVHVGALQEKVQGSVSAHMGGAAGGLVVLGAAAAVAARKQRGTVHVADVEPLIELA